MGSGSQDAQQSQFHTLSRLKLTGPGCVITKVLGFWSQGQWGQHPCQAGLVFMSRAMWLLFSEHPQRRHAVKGVSLGECPPQQMEPECEWSHLGGIHCPTGHNGHVVVLSSRNQVLALLKAMCTYRHLHPGLSHVFPGEFKPRLQGHMWHNAEWTLHQGPANSRPFRLWDPRLPGMGWPSAQGSLQGVCAQVDTDTHSHMHTHTHTLTQYSAQKRAWCGGNENHPSPVPLLLLWTLHSKYDSFQRPLSSTVSLKKKLEYNCFTRLC